MTSWLVPLARIYVQTAALAALFALVGRLAFRSEGREGGGPPHPALVWGRGYFVGTSGALALFVPLARLLGTARRGFAVTLVALLAALILFRPRRSKSDVSRHATTAVLLCFVLLILVFSVTNVACWTEWNPSGPSAAPGARSHFGSIHAGRYANYALLINTENRVPFLAQNMGQSMLAAFQLLLGSPGPLAALMVWVPFTLAALTLFFYGFLRSRGLSPAGSALGAFFVLLCNIGLDWRALFVFDNGCPLGLIGYTDLLLGIGTFLVFVSWLEDSRGPDLPGRLLPALLGMIWCWCAPQMVVLALPVFAAAMWARRGEKSGAGERQPIRWAMAVLIAGVLIGAAQLGSLLPRGLQEQTSVLTVSPSSGLKVRPYVLYLISHWSEDESHWNIQVGPGANVIFSPRVYEDLWRQSAARGQGAVVAALTFAVGQCARSALVYFFPIAGLVLLWLAARRPRSTIPAERFWIALAVFGSGYAIAFLFELGGMKWWLTRFLVPGTVLCLLWGFEALAESLRGLTAWSRWAVLAAVLVVATAAPLVELGWVCRENLVRMQRIDPIGRRMHMMVALDQLFPE